MVIQPKVVGVFVPFFVRRFTDSDTSDFLPDCCDEDQRRPAIAAEECC
jgi:hypothetical protein